MHSVRIEGVSVIVGDWVGFKADIEQSGKIVSIKASSSGIMLTLENHKGFEGRYIGGSHITTVPLEDCWLA